MANCPAASVATVWASALLFMAGDMSIRVKETNARRTGSPVAAFDTWPLMAHESSGLVWAASASGNNRSAAIHRMISECHRLWEPGFYCSRSAGNRVRSRIRFVNSSMVRYLSCSRSR